MDRRERFASTQDALRLALDGRQSTIWTALPGIINSYDPSAVTATVQPAVKGVVGQPDGSALAVDLPLLLDVPVCFPRGGGVTLTFPIAVGDECLVVFSSRCIDGWWQSGGVQVAPEMRMHDLSDAIAFVGIQSQAKKISGISASAAELRTDDGAAKIALDAATGAVTISAPTITLTGVVTINDRVFMTHTHSDPQGGNTGGVN